MHISAEAFTGAADLQNLAREVQELLSQKIGVGSVAEIYSSIRRTMSMRREERKRASALAVVNNPEIDAKRRAKKTENKAKAKKRKSASYADNKLRYGQKGGSKRMRQE
jgi:U3 small nucleolar RNA-associated protein 20